MSFLSVLRVVLMLGLLVQPALMTWAFPGTKAVLLVAKPQVQGPYFARSVVLVTRHGQGSAVGLVLNRPTEVLLKRLGGADAVGNQPLYVGGPVDLDIRGEKRRDPGRHGINDFFFVTLKLIEQPPIVIPVENQVRIPEVPRRL